MIQGFFIGQHDAMFPQSCCVRYMLILAMDVDAMMRLLLMTFSTPYVVRRLSLECVL